MLAATAAAESLTFFVKDIDGNPLPNVAVVVESTDADGSAQLEGTPRTAEIDQNDEMFVPEFLVVQRGTRVSFPNTDSVMHHVYSFSDAKTFELPLYHGAKYKPVAFDRSGIVVLGCNVHDHMIGHILVVDSPRFAMTNVDGIAYLDAPATVADQVRVWHPRLGEWQAVQGALDIDASETRFDITIRRRWQSPAHGGSLAWQDGY